MVNKERVRHTPGVHKPRDQYSAHEYDVCSNWLREHRDATLEEFQAANVRRGFIIPDATAAGFMRRLKLYGTCRPKGLRGPKGPRDPFSGRK